MGVLKCDCSVANAYVEKTVTFPGSWYLQAKVAIPTAAFASIISNNTTGSMYTPFFIRISDGSTNTTGILAGDPAGDAAGLTSPATVGTPAGYETGVFTADAWNLVQLFYDGSTTHWKLNSVDLDANLAGPLTAGAPAAAQFGGPFANFFSGNHAGIVFYIDDVKIGTTLGGSELFSDDFEGTLSAWSVHGDSTIVSDPGYSAAPSLGGAGGDDTTTFTGPVRVGVAFNDTTLEPAPTWTYLNDGSSRVAAYQIDRGRQFEFDKTDGGTATVSINDRDGTLDPTNTSGPYYGLIEPLLQIKIELWNPVSLQYFTRFRGWIETFSYTVEPSTHQDLSNNTVGVTRLEIQCVDIFAILTAIEMQPDGSFGDTPPTTPVDMTGNIFFDNASAQDRIAQVLDNANIPPALYVVFTLNVDMQESVYSPSENVLQVVQDAADAEFPTVSNVYGDRLGRLAVHGRFAKFDPDGVAAGAGATAWPFTRWQAGDGKAVAASPTDTAHLRTLSYDRGLSKVFNSALCTPTGIDNTDVTTVTGADIAGQYYQDAPSIAQFGFRSWSAENLLIGADTGDPLTTAGAGTTTGNNALEECLAFATYIVTNYKTPRNRIGEITFKSIHPDAEGAGANWDLLCQADISDVLEVTVRGPGDADTAYIFNAEEFFIEGVHETARPATGEYAMVELSLDTSPKAYFPIGGDSGLGG